MRIDIRNLNREPLFSVQVDLKDPSTVVRPPDAPGPEIYLHWDQAFDDQHFLRHCPVCGCTELFVRKDFPQVTGFVIVVLAAVLSMVLFGLQHVLAAVAVLVAVALMDLLIYFFTGKCLVCYRCRSEFRDLPIHPEQKGWELAVGEKYREGSLPTTPPPPEAPKTPEDKTTARGRHHATTAGARPMSRRAPKSIVIYGGGGHGLVVAEAAEAAGWKIVGFLDDALPVKQPVGRWKVVALEKIGRKAGIIIGIGDNATRGRIFRRMVGTRLIALKRSSIPRPGSVHRPRLGTACTLVRTQS